MIVLSRWACGGEVEFGKCCCSRGGRVVVKVEVCVCFLRLRLSVVVGLCASFSVFPVGGVVMTVVVVIALGFVVVVVAALALVVAAWGAVVVL